MKVSQQVLRLGAPQAARLAPETTAKLIYRSMHHAIEGVGPLAGAAEAAEKQLAERPGDLDRAVNEVIEFNVRLAAVEGFVTNLGGIVVSSLLMPANVAGSAVIQLRMVAGIAHLRGYDVNDPAVRNAILACLLGKDSVKSAVKGKRLPARPYDLANATTADPELHRILAAEVTSSLIAKAAGKRVVGTVARKIPVVGGVVGGSADAYDTWKVGRYTDKELFPRRKLRWVRSRRQG